MTDPIIDSKRMSFCDSRMTISEIISDVWQGAMPQPGADFSFLGPDVHVYVMCPCEYNLRGCAVTYAPMQDNPHDPVEDPPKIIGQSLTSLEHYADEIIERRRAGKKSVSLCQWGYNRSALLVGLAMARSGYTFEGIMRMMLASRGPHPCGFGDPLNNHNFRALVKRQAGVR